MIWINVMRNTVLVLSFIYATSSVQAVIRVFPFDENEVIVTQDNGLFLYDGYPRRLRKITSDASESIIAATRINNRRFIICGRESSNDNLSSTSLIAREIDEPINETSIGEIRGKITETSAEICEGGSSQAFVIRAERIFYLLSNSEGRWSIEELKKINNVATASKHGTTILSKWNKGQYIFGISAVTDLGLASKARFALGDSAPSPVQCLLWLGEELELFVLGSTQNRIIGLNRSKDEIVLRYEPGIGSSTRNYGRVNLKNGRFTKIEWLPSEGFVWWVDLERKRYIYTLDGEAGHASLCLSNDTNRIDIPVKDSSNVSVVPYADRWFVCADERAWDVAWGEKNPVASEIRVRD